MTDVEGVARPNPSGGGDPLRSSIEPTSTTVPSDALAAVPAEVVRQSGDAIMVSDADYVVRAWNPAAERLYGIPAGDAIGAKVSELWGSFHVDGTPLDSEPQREALERDGTWRGRIVQRPSFGTRAGSDVIVDTVATLLRDGAGTVSGILVINRDVSTSARVEAEMATLGSLVVATDRARSKSEVAEAALDILCRATGAEAGLVTSMDRAYEATAQRGVEQATIDIILAYGQLGGPLAQALQPAEAFISSDVASAPLREDVRAALIGDGLQHLVVVGLHLSGRLLGVLALGWRQPVANPPSKAIVLQAAALVAAAMENARLLEAVESGLAQERTLTRRFRALLELTRLPDAAPIDGLGLERLVADIGSIIGADSAIFARVDGDRLSSVAIHGIEPDLVEPLLDWPLIDPAVKARLRRGNPTFLTPMTPDPTGTAAAGDGSSRYRTVAAFPIREDGRLTALLFSLFEAPVEELDIDERTLEAIGRVLDISFVNRSLRQVVASSETRYRALFERSPDALLVESGDGIVLDANPAARRLYGGDLVGRPVDELVEGGRGYVDTGSEEFRRHGLSGHVGVGRRLDGSTFPKEVDLHPLAIEGEARALTIVRDLTERTRLQGELIQAQKMEAIGLLVAGVAHELNNPLASIVAFSQLLRTDPQLPEDLRRQAEMLVQEANRTRVIVQNLLDFARARPAERLPTDLGPLVDSVLVLQSYSFGKGGLEVKVDIPADLPPILIDRAQMQQVLINLTVNAAQAIRDSGVGGRLRIEANAAVSPDLGDVVRIEIGDDGPGVPPELLDRLFMPFVTSKAPGKGTGLGLSVSFGIVTGHGGTLRHETGPGGRGTTFVIELPLGVEPGGTPPAAPSGFAGLASAAIGETEAARPAPPSSAAAAAADGSPPRPIRVLVLDDEMAIREFLARALRRAGYEPVLAPTGPAALDMIRSSPPDAILCDHRMAGMNGTEFHDAVAATAPELGRRFAFMSGDVLNPELREFATSRGILLLAKPFDIATVGRTVAALLGSEPVA